MTDKTFVQCVQETLQAIDAASAKNKNALVSGATDKVETYAQATGYRYIDNIQPIRESIGAGTVVRMKSGGPNMVVIERSTNWAYLTWQKDDGNDVLKDWVPITCLEVVK